MLPLFCFTGNILCTMEGSCAGSSLTLPLVVHTWPTPSCLPPSLLYPMTMLTTRLCLLHAHLWWASTSPSLAPMRVLCKLVWSTQSQQMLGKDHCHWAQHMGWPARGGEAWSGLMFSQRYRGSTALLWHCHIYIHPPHPQPIKWACTAYFCFSCSNSWVCASLQGVAGLQQGM